MTHCPACGQAVTIVPKPSEEIAVRFGHDLKQENPPFYIAMERGPEGMTSQIVQHVGIERDLALEKAARIAEGFKAWSGTGSNWSHAANIANQIAREIRKMRWTGGND